MWIKPPSKSLKILRSIRWILCNVKETFFKKLGRKIWRFSMHVKHKSLIFVMKKKLVNNYMFEIDIKNTRTRCEICSKITTKTPIFFSIVDFQHVFVCWVVTFIFIVWMVFIILIILLEFGVHSEISLEVSHISIFVRNASLWRSQAEG